MSFHDYFKASTGGWPRSGSIGLESDWFDVGTLHLPTGELWVGCCFDSMRDDGCVVRVSPGMHRISIKGMDFEGHRRAARARLCLDSSEKATITAECGQVGVDGGIIAFCDICTFENVVLPQYFESFLSEYGKAAMAACFESYGIRSTVFTYAGQSIGVAFMQSGLGDGTYPVYALRSGGQVVGLEVEFLAPEYQSS